MEFVSSKKLEVVAKFLVDDEVDGVAPCSYLNNYLKRDRVDVPCDVGDCEDNCPFYSTSNFVKWIKEPDRKVEVEDLKKPHQEDFTKYVNCSDALFDRDSYINALEKYCNDLKNVLSDTKYDLEMAKFDNRELADKLEQIRGILDGKD